MIKVSIIVCCYNIAEYIEKCLQSICNQTLKDIEIIVVDDNSTDNTIEIVKRYVSKYSNVKYLSAEKKGVSAARNQALRIAQGEYVGFVDGDDYIDKTMYEKMYNAAIINNSDIVGCDALAVYPHKKVYIPSKMYDGQSIDDLLINGYVAVWNKIYKRDILENIEFNEELSFCENVLFLFDICLTLPKVTAVNEILYYYTQRSGSLTYSYDEKLYHLIDSMDCIVDHYKNAKLFDKYYQEIEYTYVRYLYATFIKRLSKTRNKKKFDEGYNTVIRKVNENFPQYRKNKYLADLKGFYLKYFNKLFADFIFIVENNRMN